MKESFIIYGLSSVEYRIGSKLYTCRGRVSIRGHGGQSVIGYVMSENIRKGTWTIHLTNNSLMKKPCLKYFKMRHQYMYPITPLPYVDYRILAYRLIIKQCGELKFTMNRVVFYLPTNKPILNHSS